MNEVLRPKALLELLAEIDQMDETLFPPTKERGEGERVLGDMTPWMCKCFALARHYAKMAKMLVIEHDVENFDDAMKFPEISEAKSKSELLTGLLYYTARSEFQAFSIQMIGTRVGCKFVGYEKQDDGPEELLRRLFGSSQG